MSWRAALSELKWTLLAFALGLGVAVLLSLIVHFELASSNDQPLSQGSSNVIR